MLRSILKSGILGLMPLIVFGYMSIIRFGSPIFLVYIIGFILSLVLAIMTCIEKIKSYKSNTGK